LEAFDINKVYALLEVYNSGRLGGEKMPEDENPGLDKSSKENYLYFTLPMALNYQRNSYTLWECANKTYRDVDTADVFDVNAVIDTHVIQASERLGLITSKETGMGNVQEIVANRWKEVLMETDLVPIDVHTPMWLWSRGKFKVEI